MRRFLIPEAIAAAHKERGMDILLKLAAVLITLSIMLTIIASTVIVTAFLTRMI